MQNGFWGFKVIFWLGLVIAAFFIPNEFFVGWRAYIDIPGAAIFILIQIILLIDFAYTTSESLVGESFRSSLPACCFMSFAFFQADAVLIHCRGI